MRAGLATGQGLPVRRGPAAILLAIAAGVLALAAAGFILAWLGADLPLSRQWALINGQAPRDFADIRYLHAALPRAAMALLVGATLGLVGSLLQQVTQNPLVSPMTIGASSGAWLALVAMAAFFPALENDHSQWIAMAGAAMAVGLVLMIAGRDGISGLPVVLAGMAVTILCNALARGIALMDEQATQDLFIWSAGDLTQTGWETAFWLWPRLVLGAAAFAFAPRILALMRLGHVGAAARGLAVWPVLAGLILVALWLTGLVVSAVGIIGFIGLLAPHVAALAGIRRPGDALVASALCGALLLCATEAIGLITGDWLGDLVPSGASAALIGAPALILLTRRRMRAGDHVGLRLLEGRDRLGRGALFALAIGGAAVLAAAACLAPGANGWRFDLPDGFIWSLRWPRILAAFAAGAGMALAGTLLQRLVRNPLASPDIIGMTQGATLALVLSAMFFGMSVHAAGLGVAFLGSTAVLGLILGLGRRHAYAPGIVILIGISLAALADAILHFALASGSSVAFSIVNWLGGSTYRIDSGRAFVMAAAIAALFALCLALSRWLTLVSIEHGVAAARGLVVGQVRAAMLLIAASAAAAVTALMGPVGFVGLVAPHLATLLGARTARPQLVVAVCLGGGLMVLSDWLGRVLAYPFQLPAGTIASIIGGVYFVALLARAR